MTHDVPLPAITARGPPMIRQPWLLGIAALFLLGALVLSARQASFLMTARTSTGQVVRVDSRNSTCGRKRHRHSCTKFEAIVDFPTLSGTTAQTRIDAGSSRGSNQPVTSAHPRTGETVPIVYAPGNPSRAYRDRFTDVWFFPMVLSGGALAFGLGSLTRGRGGVHSRG